MPPSYARHPRFPCTSPPDPADCRVGASRRCRHGRPRYSADSCVCRRQGRCDTLGGRAARPRRHAAGRTTGGHACAPSRVGGAAQSVAGPQGGAAGGGGQAFLRTFRRRLASLCRLPVAQPLVRPQARRLHAVDAAGRASRSGTGAAPSARNGTKPSPPRRSKRAGPRSRSSRPTSIWRRSGAICKACMPRRGRCSASRRPKSAGRKR